jgi:GT2 family glycosyltransferase
MNERALPLVSVVVVSWKGADVVAECLDSLCAQNYPALEIILAIGRAVSSPTVAVHARGAPPASSW